MRFYAVTWTHANNTRQLCHETMRNIERCCACWASCVAHFSRTNGATRNRMWVACHIWDRDCVVQTISTPDNYLTNEASKVFMDLYLYEDESTITHLWSHYETKSLVLTKDQHWDCPGDACFRHNDHSLRDVLWTPSDRALYHNKTSYSIKAKAMNLINWNINVVVTRNRT